jgi:hypothetical protein
MSSTQRSHNAAVTVNLTVIWYSPPAAHGLIHIFVCEKTAMTVLKILGATTQNAITRVTICLGFLHPRPILTITQFAWQRTGKIQHDSYIYDSGKCH